MMTFNIEAARSAKYKELRSMFSELELGNSIGISTEGLREAIIEALEGGEGVEAVVEAPVEEAPVEAVEEEVVEEEPEVVEEVSAESGIREQNSAQRTQFGRMQAHAIALSESGAYPELSDEARAAGFKPYHEGILGFEQVGGTYAKSGRCSIPNCTTREITDAEREADMVTTTGPLKGWAAYTKRPKAYCLTHALAAMRRMGVVRPFAHDEDNTAHGFATSA